MLLQRNGRMISGKNIHVFSERYVSHVEIFTANLMQNILQLNPGLRVERLVTLLTIFGKQVSLHHPPTVINSSDQ